MLLETSVVCERFPKAGAYTRLPNALNICHFFHVLAKIVPGAVRHKTARRE